MENIQNSPYKDVRPIFNSRYWTTPPYEGIYFNDFIFHGLRPNILDRVIINDMSGSSLHFKRFVSLSLKILDNNVQAELINFEVDVEEGNIEEEENEFSDDSDLDSLSSFIDNEETENDINFYHNLDNVETDIEQTLKAGYGKGLEDIENFDEISNLCESSEDESEIDEFEIAAKKFQCFSETLLPKTNPDVEIEHNNFVRITLHALRYDKENKADICDKNKFKKVIDEKLIDQLDEEKYKFILDLQKFNNNCYEINYLLSKYNYFSTVFELKNKFDI